MSLMHSLYFYIVLHALPNRENPKAKYTSPHSWP